jgi:hypothetical protein
MKLCTLKHRRPRSCYPNTLVRTPFPMPNKTRRMQALDRLRRGRGRCIGVALFRNGECRSPCGNLWPQPGDQRTGPQFAHHRSIRIRKPRGQSGSSSRACEECEGIPEDEAPPASLGLVTCCRQNCGDLQQPVDNGKNRPPLQWLEREPKPPPSSQSKKKTRRPAGRPTPTLSLTGVSGQQVIDRHDGTTDGHGQGLSNTPAALALEAMDHLRSC